jgi:hypothetical protein
MSRFIVNSVVSADGNASMLYAARANVANAAGGAEGDAVTTPIAFVDQYGVGVLPEDYAVTVTPNQVAFASVTNKTAAGFDVTLTPLAGATLAAGSFDLAVMA